MQRVEENLHQKHTDKFDLHWPTTQSYQVAGPDYTCQQWCFHCPNGPLKNIPNIPY